jgi:Transglycosylase SLT domain
MTRARALTPAISIALLGTLSLGSAAMGAFATPKTFPMTPTSARAVSTPTSVLEPAEALTIATAVDHHDLLTMRVAADQQVEAARRAEEARIAAEAAAAAEAARVAAEKAAQEKAAQEAAAAAAASQQRAAQEAAARAAQQAAAARAAQQAAAARAAAAAPRPVAAPAPAASGSIPDIITAAFSPMGPGAVTWALRIAKCESGYNPNAVNASSNAKGLFQFLPSTWASTPYAGSSPFDPVANAKAAAWLYGRSGPGQWECR